MMRMKSLATMPGWFLLAISLAVIVLLISSIMWQMQSTLMLAANTTANNISKSNFRSVQSGGASLQLRGQESNFNSRKNRNPTSLDSEYALDADQLEALLSQRDQPSVVAYFAPWCGHCQVIDSTLSFLVPLTRSNPIPKLCNIALQYCHLMAAHNSTLNPL